MLAALDVQSLTTVRQLISVHEYPVLNSMSTSSLQLLMIGSSGLTVIRKQLERPMVN